MEVVDTNYSAEVYKVDADVICVKLADMLDTLGNFPCAKLPLTDIEGLLRR